MDVILKVALYVQVVSGIQLEKGLNFSLSDQTVNQKNEMFKTTLLVASQSFITLEMEGQNKCISLCDTASHKITELHGKQMNFKEYHIITNTCASQ